MLKERKVPISIYLTPKAAIILDQYNNGSGYGSKSRTAEEIIFAFDTAKENMKIISVTLNRLSSDKNVSSDFIVHYLTTLIASTAKILSRLNKPT